MAYSDFSFDLVQNQFSLIVDNAPLFSENRMIVPPAWLTHYLDSMALLARGSEKARSEFIIAPLLSVIKELNEENVGVFSGQSLNVSPLEGLTGECDFLLASPKKAPLVSSPVFSVVEAKKNDIDLGWGQCAAQLVGVQRYNALKQSYIPTLFGCITTGEDWQFLKLEEKCLTFDANRYYINNIPLLLGVLQTCIDTSLASKTRNESPQL